MAQADIKAHRMKRDTDLQDESSESSTVRTDFIVATAKDLRDASGEEEIKEEGMENS